MDDVKIKQSDIDVVHEVRRVMWRPHGIKDGFAVVDIEASAKVIAQYADQARREGAAPVYDMLLNAVADIAALCLIMGREDKIAPMTEEYVRAINAFDKHTDKINGGE